MHIAIIGAGLAGLSCAKHLAAAGHDLSLFDKGRGPGGRLSGRRHELGAIDHGAQYFTVRDESFQQQVDDWLASGIVARWTGSFVEDRPEGLKRVSSPRFIGAPRMNSLIRALIEPFSIEWKTRICSIQRIEGRWQLLDTEGKTYGLFDQVVIAVPPIQAAELLMEHPALCQQVQACSADPCWALMLWFAEGERITTAWDAWSSVTHPSLGWVAWEQSKPGRATTPRLVAHAQAQWSTEFVELPAEQVIQALLSDLRLLLGPLLDRHVDVQAHRWRYAKTAQAMGQPALYDPHVGLGVCGDWCLEGRIEAAWVSGRALAQQIAT